jgi:putative oxidoreductase
MRIAHFLSFRHIAGMEMVRLALGRVLRLDFIPRMPDVALLLLRVWLGLTMLLVHGWDKLISFQSKVDQFPSIFGMGSGVSLGLAVFAEAFCATLLVIGFLSRTAAAVLAVTMGVAFFVVHEASLAPGPGSGELAFVFMAGFVTLVLTGPGRWSLDAIVFGRSAVGRY